ncbi:2-oxoacid:acceptor oxidoreductase family protein [Caldisericum exile]|uniref:2-oxoglutarate ferredoxin oxidoreductase gamma subunit n=1 Tax=Caldisericum exile (strain DSM 21853 / NBRC 104410 / AZM16c01) TaxID=511051 RepID=A0A7U6JEW2_CALEA|nr:2-oxoacid:acceptor oxidoreductase family protein [Caldisericum exile]BAL81141.1 2-oxoglutarate ferredoxin oxidoreductase gamma subunit [Caldisericum exile AZM16c01]
MRKEIRIAGSGGQGIISASIILAEASGIYDGKNVLQSQVYGAAARGEMSKADVIISDEEINFPEVRIPDVLIALTQDAYDEFTKFLKRDSIVILDEFYVYHLDDKLKNFPFSITKTSVDITGRQISANIVALGILSGLTGIVTLEALKRAVVERFKNRSEPNIKALEKGYELGTKEAINGKTF